MKKFALFGVVLAAFLFMLTGCQQGTTTPTGSGGKITLEKPSDVSLNRGDTATVKVSLKRNNYADPVTISFEDLPKGVTVTSTDMKIAKDQNSGSFNVKAADDAELGDKTVKVIATDATGHKVDSAFKVTVKDKEKKG